MKYKDGRTYCRMLGQARNKNNSLHDSLGHSFNIRDKSVVFIGEQGETFSLTKGKEYAIVDADNSSWDYDESLREKFKHLNYNKSRRLVETAQYHGGLLTLMNDKGHKRKYYHNMFKLVEDANANLQNN